MRRHLLFVLLVSVVPVCRAAFTHSTRWKLDTIDETFAGTWCYQPGPNPVSQRACTNATLNAFLDAHTNNKHGSGLSIAYYDLQDSSTLGGSGWDDWSAVPGPVGVCMSGAVAMDNSFRTTCRFASTDDDHHSPAAHAEECTVLRPQQHVTDGCYTPPPVPSRFRLNDTASAVLTILGLVIVLPGMVLGAHRWYRARRLLQQTKDEDGQAVPLVVASAAKPVSPTQ